MKIFKPALYLLVGAVLIMTGCATPGPKYIDISYTKFPDPGQEKGATLGISRFVDARNVTSQGSIGRRTLNDKSKEIFLVRGLDLALTLTDVTQTFLERKGFKVSQSGQWTPTLEGLSAVSPQTDYLLSAKINDFQCIARKKAVVTDMRLDIDIDFFLARPAQKKLTTIPVILTLTRTDINFTRNKLESFFNQALAEALEKALNFDRP